MSEETIINIVKKINKQKEVDILSVPIVDDFRLEIIHSNNIIFHAVGTDKSSETLICDGKLNNDESFEDRLQKVISETIEANINNGIENSEKSVYFYTKIIDTLEFYIYFIDYIKLVGSQKRVIRQINAYFLEPVYNNFYQLSLNTAPFLLPTKIMKIGENFDLDKDSITKSLVNTLMKIIKNIEYK